MHPIVTSGQESHTAPTPGDRDGTLAGQSAVVVQVGAGAMPIAPRQVDRSQTDPAYSSWKTTIRAYVQTTKPGITKLVTITSMVGLAMALADRWALGERSWSLGSLVLLVVGCIVGTALSASGANALNQWAERERDAKMPRTAKRPLPSGRLNAAEVFMLGVILSVLGVGLLWWLNGAPAAVVSGACVLVYLFLYTPMKATTWTATLIGAIPGALPPLIGWSAGHSEQGFAALIEPGGMSLFWLMAIWQLPHFLAIAWMYRDDYELGGCAVLPVIDRSGTKTALVISFFTLLLLPATLWPAWAMDELLGPLYIGSAVLSWLVFGSFVLNLLRHKERDDARKMFFASIIHLPLLLIVMVLDAVIHTAL